MSDSAESGRPPVGVVVVAAGSGTRYGAEVPKAFVRLEGRTLLARALDAVLGCPGLVSVAVVAPGDHLDRARAEVESSLEGRPTAPEVRVVPGGAERHDSVAAGLAALDGRAQVVLVHDAARALTPPAVFVAVVDAVAAGAPAVVPGLPVVDTVKQVGDDGIVTATLPRAHLRIVQTPQGFRRDVLERAHAAAGPHPVTDDATLVEGLGLPVRVIPGDPRALKITTPDDLSRVAVLEQNGAPRDHLAP